MTKSQSDITNKSKQVSPFQAGDHKSAMNRREAWQTQDINNTNDPQKKYRLGTVSKIFYWRAGTSITALTLPLILMWTGTHLGTWRNTTNTTAKRSALSQQVTTRLQGTDATAQHTPTWSITNKNDPQKKHLLGTVSKMLLLESLKRFHGANITLVQMWIKTHRCLVFITGP